MVVFQSMMYQIQMFEERLVFLDKESKEEDVSFLFVLVLLTAAMLLKSVPITNKHAHGFHTSQC